MAKPEEKITSSSSKEEKKSDLRGTFISVMILGVFLLGSWFGVWALYLSR